MFLWGAAVVGPILLTGISAVYYSYELVAVIAICLALAADYHGQRDSLFRSIWIVVIFGVGVGAYWNNHNLDRLAWYYCGNLAKHAYTDLVAPNRCSAIRSMVIVTPTAADAERVGYVLGPDGLPGHRAMLNSLLAPQNFPTRILTMEHVSNASGQYARKQALDDLAADPADFVYMFDPGSFSFRRYTPFRPGECLEDFETDINSVHPVWVENTKTRFAINHQTNYVSDGRQSLMIGVKASDTAAAHYAGIRLPATHSDGLMLDGYVLRPETLKAVHIWEVDAHGNPIFGWANMAPSATFGAGQRTRIELRRYADSDTGFVWNRELKNPGVPEAVYVIVEMVRNGETTLYLDHFCVAAR